MSRAQDNPDKARRPAAGAGGQGGAGRGLGPAAPAQKIALPLPSVTGKKPSVEAGKAVCQPALPGRELRKPSPASVFKEAVKEAVKTDKAVAAAAAQKAQAPPKPLPPPQPPTLGQDRKKATLVKVPVPQVAVKPKIVAPQPPAKLAQEPAKSKPQLTKDRREGKELTRGTLTQPTPDVTRHDHEEGEVTVKENEMSEQGFTETHVTTIGTRKTYHFQDPPLPKEVHVAVVLLLLAILTVALFLGYDVYHSFAHLPRRSNVTARSQAPVTTTPLPTPFFMR